MSQAFNDRLRERKDLSAYQKQARSLLFHKAHVIKAGLMVGGISIRRLLFHDASKLTLVEFSNYSRFKYGIKSVDGWAKAWLHHMHNNPHHPEHWISSWRGNSNFYNDFGQRLAPFVTVLPMPETYIREFVIDMMATSMEITSSYNIAAWLNENGPKINMHHDTRIRLDSMLIELDIF